MRIRLIAFDSMGVRSMATLVETSEVTIFIDPGAALGPRRYGLPPHEVELKVLEEKLAEIHRLASEADVLVITHYHRDHYLYRKGEEEFYRGKVLYVKHPCLTINPSQRIRAYVLYKKMGVEENAKKVVYADGYSTTIGRLRLEFSTPLYHGECGSRLGWVLAVSVEEEGFRLVHASDVQGFTCRDSLSFVETRPWDVLIVSGPPTYLMSKPELELATKGLVEAAGTAKEGAVAIVDHHLLRDRNYRSYLEYFKRRTGVKVLTAAEFMGLEVRQLEAFRDKLWGVAREGDIVEEPEE